jgi:hypothetical protein
MTRSIVKSLPFLAGLLIACAVGAGVFGLAQTLLKPRPALEVAASALGELDPGDFVVSRVRLGGRDFQVRCQPLAHRRALVTVGGARLLVFNTRVRLAGRAVFGPSKARAIADLAGCPLVLGAMLTSQVQRAFAKGKVVPLLRHGRDYWIPLTGRRPLVVLEVSRATLEPVGVVFRGRVLRGTSSIHEIRRGKARAA